MLLLRLKLSCVRDDWRERLIRGGGGRFKPRSKDMWLGKVEMILFVATKFFVRDRSLSCPR